MQTVPLIEFQNRCVVLLKQVEEAGESLLITENGHPVARIVPCEKNLTEKRTEELLAMLRGSVQYYKAPEEPVGLDDWDGLQC